MVQSHDVQGGIIWELTRLHRNGAVNSSHPPSALSTADALPWVEVLGSRYLSAWLAEQRVSVAFTTYQAGKLFFVGRKPNEQLSVFERTFNRCLGLCASSD